MEDKPQTKQPAKKSNKKEQEAYKEFYKQAKEVRQMYLDGIVWRKVIKAFAKLDFDKVDKIAE